MKRTNFITVFKHLSKQFNQSKRLIIGLFGTLLILATFSQTQAQSGTLDMAFNPNANERILVLAIQPDGKIVIGGTFTTVGGVARNRIARLNTDGALDTAFDPNVNSSISSLAIQPDGKIVIGGSFTTVGGVTRNRIARLNTDGALDTNFNPNVNTAIFELAIQPDGKIVIVGVFTTVGGVARNNIARLNTDGALDMNFNPNVNATQLNELAIQPDGKIVIGGTFTTVGGVARNNIARLNTDGALDTAFNPNVNATVGAIAIQPDGKIVIGGSFTTIGGVTRNRIARLNTDGALDMDFNPNANDSIFDMAIQPDGKTVIGGPFTTIGGIARNRIARINADIVTQPTLKADYQFQGNLNSSVAGAPAMTNIGTNSFVSETIEGNSRQSLRFPLNNGVAVNTAGLIPNNAFTIVMLFKLDAVTGFRRVVDFANRTSDEGAYIQDGRLENESVNNPQFQPNTYIQAVIVREASGRIRAYRDGVLRVDVPNDGNTFAITSANLLRFFQDDLVVPNEASAGNVARIRLYDAPMTDAQVQALDRLPNLSAACPSTPIGFGQTFSSALNSGSCVTSNRFNDTYTFSGNQGDQVAITLDAAFFPGLELINAQGTVLQNVGGGDSFKSVRLPASQGYFTLPAAGNYSIRVSSNFQGTGDYSLSLYKAPPSSSPCTYSLSSPRTNVASTGGTFSIDILTQNDCPPALSPNSFGLIYSVVSYGGGRLTFSVNSNSGATDRQETITVGGLTHTIFQYGSVPPVNDLFGGATPLFGVNTPPDAPVIGYNNNASAEPPTEPAHNGKPAAKSVWYRWTSPAAAGLYSFSTSGSSFDTVMAIYACPTIGDCTLSNITAVGSNDDTTDFDKTSKVNFRAAANTTYYIAVDGKNGASGAIQLTFQQYERLYRLYLQTFNGDPTPLTPDSVAASNGNLTFNAKRISQGVYEFNLPADKTVYTVTISGPTGIVWTVNNFPLGTSFSVQNEPIDGNQGEGESIVSNAQNAIPRIVTGYIKNITGQELDLLSVKIGSSRGANPRDPVDCGKTDSPIGMVPYITYQCQTQPNTLHDIIPNMVGKKFTDPIKSFAFPILINDNGSASKALIASNSPTFVISGRVLGGGAGTKVDLTYSPGGNAQTVTLPTMTVDASGYYEFKDLPPGVYALKASRTGFVFVQPADVALQTSGATVDIAVQQACTYEPMPVPSRFSFRGGANSFVVKTNNSTCGWTATSLVPWIQISSGAAIGDGPVHFTVDANTTAPRSGVIRVNGQDITIEQIGLKRRKHINF